MIGLMGSGKTTYARKIQEKYPDTVIHSSDDIRIELFGNERQDKNKEVFEVLHQRIKRDLAAGLDIIYDATNINRKRRKHIIEYIARDHDVIGVFVFVPYETILERAKIRTERQIPRKDIDRFLTSFDVPLEAEGFTQLLYVYPDDYVTSLLDLGYEHIVDKFGMKDYDQNSSYHNLTLDKHIQKVHENVLELDGSGLTDDALTILSIAALLHDIGKPFCRTDKPDGTSSYYSHEKVGAYHAVGYLYRAPEGIADTVLAIIAYHMRAHQAQTLKAKDKITREIGEWDYTLLKIFADCDERGKE